MIWSSPKNSTKMNGNLFTSKLNHFKDFLFKLIPHCQILFTELPTDSRWNRAVETMQMVDAIWWFRRRSVFWNWPTTFTTVDYSRDIMSWYRLRSHIYGNHKQRQTQNTQQHRINSKRWIQMHRDIDSTGPLETNVRIKGRGFEHFQSQRDWYWLKMKNARQNIEFFHTKWADNGVFRWSQLRKFIIMYFECWMEWIVFK